MTEYYSYKNIDTDEWQGLLRYHDFHYEYARDGSWEAGDPDRVKTLFFFPGADAPELIDDELAATLAVRYGVTLGGRR
jgi:hypothetical protein